MNSALSYELDREDRVVQVSPNWEAFASSNDAPELTSSKVVGRPLWDFITDLETRHLYVLLLAQVRRGSTLRLPLRCDAPARRRFLLLTLSPLLAGGVRLESQVVREEERPAEPLLARTTPRSTALLRMCSWCQRVAVNDTVWTELEEAVARLDLFGRLPLPHISHGVCPRCSASVLGLAPADPQ